MWMSQGCKSRTVLHRTFVAILVTLFASLNVHRILSAAIDKEYALRLYTSQSVPIKQAQESPAFRMLLGIFSMESDRERHRRSLIKNTYLSFPKFMDRYNVTTVPIQFTRICSLREYWQGSAPHRKQCQLLYTWVIGAAKKSDPSATTAYLNPKKDKPMTVHPSGISDSHATYLNIIENMNEGKSQTWFKYASSQIPEDFHIDLIAKVDTDCLVYPTILLAEMERIRKEMNLSYPFHNIYGGSRQQGADLSYMQGGFYFLSTDLARYITSDQCDRNRIIEEYMPQYNNERAEDVEISRFIRTYPGHIFEMEIPRETAYYHNRKMKGDNYYRENWKSYIASIVAKDRIMKVQTEANSTCPSEDALNQGRDLIHEDLTRVRQQYEILRRQLTCDIRTSR